MTENIDAGEGRALFGADPHGYDAIRPPYPEQVYEFLVATGALRAGAATLEIGAGNGLATRRLLELGARPLTAVEPDARFAPLLTSIAASHPTDLRLVAEPFEDAALPQSHYDLVAAATSFHWVRPELGIEKVAALLKPGGYAALWWHVFGDPDREDPFHDATQAILRPLASSPSGGPEDVPYALDTARRFDDFARTGAFATPIQMIHRWTFVVNAEQVGALYATYSHISRLPQDRRRTVLDRLMEVAARDFGGRVERNMVSSVYVARRKTDGGDAG